MGFLDKIRNIFREKEVQVIKKLNLDDLSSHLATAIKEAEENASEKISGIKKIIAEEKLNLEKNIRLLEDAQLKNTEIPDRVKQIMEGNRGTYVQRINSLIGDTNIPEEFDKLLSFTNNFDETMSSFDKTIAKNHHVMSEFFVKEAGAVSSNIRNIDKKVKEISKELKEAKINSLNELKNETINIQNKIKQKTELEEKINFNEKELREQSKKIDKKENEINTEKESKEYKEFLTLTNYKQALEKDISTLNSAITHSFSEIESALKKYSNQNKEDKLTKCYLDNPIKTLNEDKDLEIIKILEKTKSNIYEGVIELKEKKKDKTLRELEKLTESYFSGFLEDIKEKDLKLSEANTQIGGSQIARQVKDLKEDLEKEQMKLLGGKQSLSKLKKDFEDINIENLKINLRKELEEKLDPQIKLV